MTKRPRSLMFAVDERPDSASLTVLAVQHAALSALFLVYAAVVAKGAGFNLVQQQAMVVGTLLSCGIGAMIQAGAPRFSSGLLIIPISSPMFVIFGIPAGQEAGPAGIATLAVVGGLVQIFVGQMLRRVRKFFPPEVCGVVVLMLGISIVPLAIKRMAGHHGDSTSVLGIPSIITGLATLATIIICAVWLKGSKRYFAMLIGCSVGYGFAATFGMIDQFSSVAREASYFSLPYFVLPDFSLNWSFTLTYMVVAMIAAIDSMGVIISADRLDDADWSKPNIPQISKGISSLGLTTILSCLLGGTHLGFSATNIGLAFATGVTSRIVGLVAGAIMIAISFFPKILVLVIAMPEPILGGILAYAGSYFIVSGAQLSLSRMLSPRRMIVVGLSVGLGVGLQSNPALVAGVDGVLGIFLQSPLLTASVSAIILNAVMLLGIAQKASVEVMPGAERHEQVQATFEGWGELWGLKPATMVQASQVTNQLLEAVSEFSEGPIRLEAQHDDLNIDISIIYRGKAMIFPDRAPTPEELLEDPDGMARMSGWLVRHLASKATPFSRDDLQGVLLRFES